MNKKTESVCASKLKKAGLPVNSQNIEFMHELIKQGRTEKETIINEIQNYYKRSN